MCTWINATMGGQIMVKLSTSGKVDKCEVDISYSRHVPGLGKKFCNEPGNVFLIYSTFLKLLRC